MRKVIFLDRDGVINFEQGDYTYKIDEFKLVTGLIDSLKQLQLNGFQFIVITNQGGISKGIYNHSDVISVHNYMNKILTNENINLLDIFYCPHHAINEKCICRKPDSLLLEKAIAKYNINVKKSYFIGDSKRDILAAEKVNVTPIKISSNDSLTSYIQKII